MQELINTVQTLDSLELTKLLPDNSIQLTIFSPPYDATRDYEDKNYSFDYHNLGKELLRTTKDGGFVIVVIQDQTKNFRKSGTTAKLQVDWMEQGWNLFECCIYSKFGTPGAWWASRFKVDHEYILMFFKGDRPIKLNKDHLMEPAKYANYEVHGTQRLTSGELVPKSKEWVQKDTKCRGTIWHYANSSQESLDKSMKKLKLTHSATFPEKLAEDIILCFSNTGDIVYDPYCGSGTSLCMAKKNQRNYIGGDIAQKYCDLSKLRLKQYEFLEPAKKLLVLHASSEKVA